MKRDICAKILHTCTRMQLTVPLRYRGNEVDCCSVDNGRSLVIQTGTWKALFDFMYASDERREPG
jgi:hypothetical protein